METNTPQAKRPIGVFDSGVGGLSILQALRAELPHEDFIYVADSGNAPYGERDKCFVTERALAITQLLHEQHHIKTLVVACNTATAAAIEQLRQSFPASTIIGVEPALKPALALSQTKRIGVMATRGTLASQKFKTLLATLSDQAEFICQPCDGLADAIERNDTEKIIALCACYTGVISPFGLKNGQVDTLVLGCTHYPFASTQLRQLLGSEIQLVSNGAPVARQTRRMLPNQATTETPGQLALFSTGRPEHLSAAVKHWLKLCVTAKSLPNAAVS